MGKQHMQSGENGLGMVLETSLDHSVVDIGVAGAVGYSPEPPLGLKKHIIPAAGNVDGYKISAKSLLGIVLNLKELPCPRSCPFPWDSVHPRHRGIKASSLYFQADNSEYPSHFKSSH